MKGLDAVFNVSLAKLLAPKSFMLLCTALLGLSLATLGEVTFFFFFWIKMTQVDYFHRAAPS